MEPAFQAHPIPQNVTNFEFHLVGDMTLKQFGYLAAGLGFAFLIFTTLSTVQPLIAWPIIVISALTGVAFAFLPIQERPLDHWVAAFFKAIFQPTTLKYSSKILKSEDPLFNRRLNHYLKTYRFNEAKKNAPLGNPNLLPTAFTTAAPQTQSSVQPSSQLGKKPSFIDKFKAGQTSFAPPPQHPNQQASLHSTLPITKPPSSPSLSPAMQTPLSAQNQTLSQPTASPTPGIIRNPQVINTLTPDPVPARFRPAPLVTHTETPPSPPKVEKPAPLGKPQDLKKTVELAEEAQQTQQEIAKIEASLSQIKQQAAQPGVDPKTYLEEFEDLLTQLQKLNDKASNIAEQLAKVSSIPTEPQQPVIQGNIEQPKPPAAPNKAKSIPTLKLTSFPNVINGIVTDSQGNYIEGAIVVAHDAQGLPVRALKSNKLGQFVAATPLPNGEYSIVVEKDSLSFDKVGVELKNEVLPPILVAAKKIQTAAQ